MGHASLLKNQAYISADNGRLTPYAPCKAAATGRCTIDNAVAWEKRLRETMNDLQSALDKIKQEYEASDEGVFTKKEENEVKSALKFAQDTLAVYKRTSYANMHFTNRSGAAKATIWLSGPPGWVLGNNAIYRHVKDMSDLIQRSAKAQDRLHAIKDIVNAEMDEPYVPYTPKPPMFSGNNLRPLLIGAGVVVGGAVVIGSVRGYRSVFRG